MWESKNIPSEYNVYTIQSSYKRLSVGCWPGVFEFYSFVHSQNFMSFRAFNVRNGGNGSAVHYSIGHRRLVFNLTKISLKYLQYDDDKDEDEEEINRPNTLKINRECV